MHVATKENYNKTLFMIVLLIGGFCTVLNQTLLTTAYPDLMKQFSISTSTVQWLTTGFLLVNGITIPLSAYMMNNIPTKKLYIGALTVFLVGTIICLFANNFNMLLAGRLVQAVGVGICMPLIQTIMLVIFPVNQRGMALGIAGIVIGLAPAIGPTLSGWIIDTYNWRYLFGLLIPITIIVIIAALFLIVDILPLTPSKLDWPSPILSTLGFGSILYGFSAVGSKGWGDPVVIVTLIVGCILVGIFSYRQRKISNPFLRIIVFKSSVYTRAAILGGVVNMAMVGAEMVLPLYLQEVRHLSPFHSGLTLLPGALLLGVIMPFAGRLFDKYGARWLAIIGMTLLSYGTFNLIYLSESTPLHYVTLFYAIRMIGVALVMMPVQTDGMNSLPNNFISSGTAIFSTTKQLFGSIGTAILVSFLTSATKKDMPSKKLLASDPSEYKVKALAATLDGYKAAFIVATIFCIVGLLLAFRLNSKKPTIDTALESLAK